MYCSNCGKPLTGKYCVYCGSKVKENFINKGSLIDDSETGKATNPTYKKIGQKDRKKMKVKPAFILVPLLILVLGIGGWVFIGFQSTRAFNNAVDEGNRYMLEENLEQAEAHFLRAIEINPREVEPYLKLADIYLAWDEPNEAIAILERGIEVVPEEYRSILEDALHEVQRPDNHTPSEDDAFADNIDEDSSFEIVWVLEPSIEADDINYIKSRAGMVINNNLRHFSSSHAVIRRGDILGLIDNNGNIMGEIHFVDVFMHGGVYALRLAETRICEEFSSEIWAYQLREGDLAPLRGDSCVHHTSRFYYYEGLQGVGQFIMNTEVPSVPMPVRSTDSSSEGVLDWFAWYEEQTGLYGVFYQGQMLTNFLFTNMGSYSEGLLAVEKDGRWGYIDRNGEIIIPIEFDHSFIDTTYDWREEVYVDRAFAYAASEGFVPVVRDGVWEMRTITGEIAIEAGRFEAIRPVIGGRSWVKQDGLWGLIEIIANEEVQANENLDENEILGEEWQVGDIIAFGPYDWRVLDVQDDQVLIITDRIIERSSYHSGWEATWENSDLRAYLNGEFLENFSEAERAQIARTTNQNPDNPWFGTPGGNSTQDDVFLLSLDEVIEYFGDSGQLNNPSHPGNEGWGFHDRYSDDRIAAHPGELIPIAAVYYVIEENQPWYWWLRSPGNSSFHATLVRDDGFVSISGVAIDVGVNVTSGEGETLQSLGHVGAGVRPALWLKR